MAAFKAVHSTLRNLSAPNGFVALSTRIRSYKSYDLKGIEHLNLVSADCNDAWDAEGRVGDASLRNLSATSLGARMSTSGAGSRPKNPAWRV